jgi:acetyl esterase/lipase
MADPEYLQPFVLPTVASTPQRQGNLDIYRPKLGDGGPHPVIVFVHGGPVPADLRPTPRDWPIYVGYGSLAAESGLVGVTVDHRLHDGASYPQAAVDVAAAVDYARGLDGVDEDRVALWFFSGGGLLMADWLAQPPAWLRCVAATYPVLAPVLGLEVDPRFEAFVAATAVSGANLEVIDVPDGQHGFDMLDHTEDSRQAVTRAMTWVAAGLHTH